MLDEREVEPPRLLQLVGLDTADIVWVLATQVVDQGAERDLELGSGCRWPSTRCSARIS